MTTILVEKELSNHVNKGAILMVEAGMTMIQLQLKKETFK